MWLHNAHTSLLRVVHLRHSLEHRHVVLAHMQLVHMRSHRKGHIVCSERNGAEGATERRARRWHALKQSSHLCLTRSGPCCQVTRSCLARCLAHCVARKQVWRNCFYSCTALLYSKFPFKHSAPKLHRLQSVATTTACPAL